MKTSFSKQKISEILQDNNGNFGIYWSKKKWNDKNWSLIYLLKEIAFYESQEHLPPFTKIWGTTAFMAQSLHEKVLPKSNQQSFPLP